LKKLNSHTIKGILLGYNNETKRYILMSKSNKRTIISKDVVFIKLIQGQECLLMKQGNLFCFVCYVEISQTTTFHVALLIS
jgi:hypothetical protein